MAIYDIYFVKINNEQLGFIIRTYVIKKTVKWSVLVDDDEGAVLDISNKSRRNIID